ncbi:interferon-induced protein 44-like isoform X2 [Nematostella vectensis]|uniref:interferon-induced protein 44-like isoform X2 n=1 Tax=Nematostella vectensis TaxID=45351 RepID=UPI00138FEEDC|nr:interferon-induced protein 44-like isoform X2 [Nematostella vectensis]
MGNPFWSSWASLVGASSKEPAKELRFLVLGPVGSGKSKFIENILSTLCGWVEQKAVSLLQHTGSLNSAYCDYNFVTLNGTEVWKITDTMGIHQSKGRGIFDLWNLIDSHRSFEKDSDEERHINNLPNCVGIVISAPSVQSMTCAIWVKMSILVDATLSKGIPVVVILTKIDQVCASVGNLPCNIFNDPTLQDLARKVNQWIPQVPFSRILPITNEKNEGENMLTLLALKKIRCLSENNVKDVQTRVECLKVPHPSYSNSTILKVLVFLLLVLVVILVALNSGLIKSRLVVHDDAVVWFAKFSQTFSFVCGYMPDQLTNGLEYELTADEEYL